MAAPATRTPPGPAADAGEDTAGRTGGDRCPVPDVADDLPDMLRRGRTCGLTGVARVEYVLTDGRRVGADLPAPLPQADITEEGDEPLTDMEAAVLTVIDRMGLGTVLSTDGIAAKSGFANSGPMREFLQSLAKAGRLKRARLGYERVS